MMRRYFVSGRVQGVGFRWFVLGYAQRLRLKGYVRNLADGRVEVLAAGTAENHAELERALRAGPPRAVVEAVEIEEPPADFPPPIAFEIR